MKHSREKNSWITILSLGISNWHRPQIFLHTVLLKAFGRLTGRWYFKQSFVETAMDNVHRINPISHFGLAVVVIARSGHSKSLFIFCLLWAIKTDNWVMVRYSMLESVWPKQKPHSMFPFTSLNSQRQTYPLTMHLNVELKTSSLCCAERLWTL